MLQKKMSLKELEGSLPNGFHDARIKKINLNYEKRIIVLEIAVDISNPDTDLPEYRVGKIVISNFLFCVIEQPDNKYITLANEGLWISGSDQISPEDLPMKITAQLPEGSFVHRFFINNWNAFLYLVAMDSQLEWS